MAQQIPRPILDKVAEQIGQGIYPGASLAIYDQGTWREAYLGTQDGTAAVTPGLVYDLASVTKVVGTGTLMLQALNEGRFELDQDFQTYYPAFAQTGVTLRQLLTHTSGLDPYIPNRDALNAEELKQALENLSQTADHSFRYTDVNFLLLGFLLEASYGQSLAELCQTRIFLPWGMTETSYGPRQTALVTVAGSQPGLVHDPKARVLGDHAGSAGLFSTVKDLKIFCQHYLKEDIFRNLWQNAAAGSKARALAWDLAGNWILHTGYTGTFVMVNCSSQQAVIFLSNRTYWKDERAQWILDRDALIQLIWQTLEQQ